MYWNRPRKRSWAARPDSISDVNRGSEFTDDEIEFGAAVEEYRRMHHVNFPTCRQFLEIAKSVGYRKVADQ